MRNVLIIDFLLDAVAAAGIEEVWLVRGYLGEQFDQLLYKYPNIRFIENPLYNDANNISSMVAARDLCSLRTCLRLIFFCITRSSSRATSATPTICYTDEAL